MLQPASIHRVCSMSRYLPEEEQGVVSDVSEDTEEPPMYKVLLHNDDYTTMEFVVHILMAVFHKSLEESTAIMLNVHRRGIGFCGLYPYEVAETKVETVHARAKEAGFPLQCTMEVD